MRACTEAEFNNAVAGASWPTPRRMSTRRTYDAVYMDRGTEVASKHQTMTRGKVTDESYMCNTDYLNKK